MEGRAISTPGAHALTEVHCLMLQAFDMSTRNTSTQTRSSLMLPRELLRERHDLSAGQ
jgi:hypothetical protein